MNPELKEQWVQALRSGEYKQGQGNLKRFADDEYRYCCLGVLCEIKGVEWNKVTGQSGDHSLYFFQENTSFLPTSFADNLGFGLRGSKEVDLPDTAVTIQHHLARMNDIGNSFNEIADWIEENL